ncbi:integrase [Pontibacillus yanchengensis]|uniref:Integrase n=1 Tax=Pontibacillus yanchengensis TaxID=462910 RepID=A0ACC7VM78_9BACI|nr:integrase [Pontibacillus yanchengensis]
MKRLGHSDDKVTGNVYRHLTEEIQIEATQKLDELMSSL